MIRIILLNGPPASGKSTLAARFVAAHPLTLNLDIDVVRGLLGGWAHEPAAAGRLARNLALAMAGETLQAGHDVVVPQLLARGEFIVELEEVASDNGAAFVEIALMASNEQMHRWFAARSAAPESSTHRDAQMLIDQLGTTALDELYDGFITVVRSRTGTRFIPARQGDEATTMELLERALADQA